MDKMVGHAEHVEKRRNKCDILSLKRDDKRQL